MKKIKYILLSISLLITFMVTPFSMDVKAEKDSNGCTINSDGTVQEMYTYTVTNADVNTLGKGSDNFINQLRLAIKTYSLPSNYVAEYSGSTLRIYSNASFINWRNQYGSIRFTFNYDGIISVSSSSHSYTPNTKGSTLAYTNSYYNVANMTGIPVLDNYAYKMCAKVTGYQSTSLSSVLNKLLGTTEVPDIAPSSPSNHYCEYKFIGNKKPVNSVDDDFYNDRDKVTSFIETKQYFYSFYDFFTTGYKYWPNPIPIYTEVEATFQGAGGGYSRGGGVARDQCKIDGNCPPELETELDGKFIENCYDRDTSTWLPVGEFTDFVADNGEQLTQQNTYITNENTTIINNNVPGDIDPKSISVSTNAINMKVNESKPIYVSLSPSYVTNRAMTWSSSKPSVATINDGIVEAFAEGTTYITVTTSNGLSEEIKITVYPADATNVPETDPESGSSIWDFLKAIVDAIAGIGTAIINGLTNLFKPLLDILSNFTKFLLDCVTSVFKFLAGAIVPSAEFMQSLKDTELPKLSDNLGFIYQPFDIVKSTMDQLASVPNGTGVISYDAINDPVYGVQIIPAGSVDFNAILSTGALGTIYSIYKVVINAGFLMMFLNFCYKKFMNFMER